MRSKSYKDKLLVIGCGYEQIDAISIANKKGYYTIGVDKNCNAPGKKFCNRFYNIDIKDQKKVLQIAKKFHIKGVLSISSDLAVPTINFIYHNIKKLKSNKFLSELATDKFLMKKNFRKNDIPSSEFDSINNLNDLNKFEKKNNFPLVLKPFFSFGQKGISLIENKKNLKNKINLARLHCQKKKVLVEKFEQGKEINIVAIIEDYKIKLIVFSHRIKSAKIAFGIADRHVYPVNLALKTKNILKKYICKIVKSIKLKNGIIYPQIILNNMKISFLEIACRIPGGKMRELVLLATGVDLIEYELFRCLGYKNIFSKIKKQKKYKNINIQFFTKLNYPFRYFKEIKNLKQINTIKGVYSLSYNLKKGDKIPNLKSSGSRFGSLITYSNKINKINKLNKMVLRKIDYV
jgi:phosphoribosylamine-glycine ligase